MSLIYNFHLKISRSFLTQLNNFETIKFFSKMCGKVTEIEGDLFSAPADYAMAHCVAADMGMGKGIAIRFKQKFGQIQNLKDQNVQPGGVAVLKDGNRFIYYLITKPRSSGKPTYQTMFSSLSAMQAHMDENGMKKLAIPRIGCGLDGLNWDKVKGQIEEVFAKSDVEVTVYNYIPK